MKKATSLFLTIALVFGLMTIFVSYACAASINGISLPYPDNYQSSYGIITNGAVVADALGSGCWRFAYLVYGDLFNRNMATDKNFTSCVVTPYHQVIPTTTENLKTYIRKAGPGAVIRVTSYTSYNASDDNGHSMVIIDSDENGAWIYQAAGNGTILSNNTIKYWSWSEISQKCVNGGFTYHGQYIKYILYPDGYQTFEQTQLIETLEFRDVIYPKTFRIAPEGWYLQGGSLVSDVNLTSIQSIITRDSDGIVIDNYTKAGLSGNTFGIKSIDANVKFSNITTAGNYTWTLIGIDSSNRTLNMEMPFTAVSSGSTSTDKMSKHAENIPVMVSAIALNQTALSLNPGGAFSLTATVSPDNATNKAINWTTSDSSVATVSASGLVTAVGVGTATITATAIDGSEKYATCSLSVNQLDNQYTNASSKIRIITQHKNDFQNLIMPGHPTLTVYEGGCGLFSIAHAIQWLSNSSLSDSNAYSLMEKLVSLKLDTAPNDESNVGGTSRGMTACLIALTNFDSSLIYHQGVMTSSYVTEEHIKSIFDQGGVIISNPAGHYVLAVGYRYYNNQLYIQVVDSSIHSTIYPGNTESNLHRGYIFDSMQEITTYQGDIGTQYWIPWNCFAGKCSHNRVFQDWWWVSGTTSISKYIINYTSPEKPEGVEIVCYESPMLDEVHQYRLEDHAEVPLMGGSFPNEVEVAWESSDPSVAIAPSADSIYMKIIGPGTAVIKCYCVDYPDVFAKFTVEVTSDSKPSIEFVDDGGVPTGNLPKGQSYELKGIISSDAPIIEVMATVYDLYTNEPVAGEIISLWGQNPIFCYPNSNTFDIYYSDINRVLKFGNLPDGAYKYELVAATSPENIVLLVDSNFTIGTGTIPVSEPDFILPEALTEIGEEAFAGISASVVKVQENVKTIGSRAFANCSKLKAIYIPESCEYIAADAFSGVVGLTIYGQEGSYAEYYANRYNFTFEKVKE